MKQKILILVGCSYAGKSSFAMETDSSYVKISRDDIRNQLFKYTDDDISLYYTSPGIKEKEDLVTLSEWDLMSSAIHKGFNIVLDNTHLRLAHLKDIVEFCKFNYTDYEIKIFNVSLDELIDRCNNSDRVRKVSEEVVRKQYRKFVPLINHKEFISLLENQNI